MSGDLVFTALRLKRGGRAILNGVSGRLKPGAVTAIIGPNGAGKSSLLHCLAGLEPKMQGEVTIGGDAIARLPAIARARRIGFLPQRGEVHWNLSARTLVALGRLACGNPDHDEEVVDGVMADLDIAHFADRPVLTLSGGELARVLLGRVLAGEPQWLLADEPLANLDPAHQVAVLDRLSAVARAGAGVVAVLHDVNHAARMAGHVLLMKEGEILAEGLPEAALTPERLEQAFGVPFRRMMDESLILFPA